MQPTTAQQIADRIGGTLTGTATATVTGVASLVDATASDLAFLGKDNARYRSKVFPSLAPIVLVPEGFDAEAPADRAWVACPDPSAAFTEFVLECVPAGADLSAGIHASAVIGDGAQISASAHIGANVTIGPGASIGERSIVQAGCVVADQAQLGDDSHLHPNVTVLDRCLLGNRVVIHSGTVIGSDGFGFAQENGQHKKIPQVGIVQIDDDVEIGANCTMDRARFGRTWVQRNCIIDNLVQLAHNVVVSEGAIIVAQAGVSGSTRIGKGAILAGQVGVAGHLEIGDGAVALGQAGVTGDVASGTQVVGMPARPKREFFRAQAALRQLPDLLRTVSQLEKRLQALESGSE